MKGILLGLALLAALPMATPVAAAPGTVDLDAYLRDDAYEMIKVSPDGRHLAATTQHEDRMVLYVVERASGKVVQSAAGKARSAIADFWWVSDDRVLLSVAETDGSRDQVFPTGDLHAFTIGEAKPTVVFGEQAVFGQSTRLGDPGYRQMATLVDTLPADPEHVLIAAWSTAPTPRTRVLRMNVRSGLLATVATAPLRRSDFAIDQAGVVRFADGADDANWRRLYYRETDAADWRLVNDESSSGRVMSVLGMAADGRSAVLQVTQPDGPDTIERWDVATGARSLLLRDPVVDPHSIVYDVDGRTPIGARFMHDGVTLRFFDETLPLARVYRALEKAAKGSAVTITSFTRDGGLAMVRVWSDRAPGDYFLADFTNPGMTPVFRRMAWLDRERMPAVRQVSLAARDGTPLHGYLTLPHGADRGLPAIVMPHGGPFGVFDGWQFDAESRLLAAAGYAVLRINFRGSGNYGNRFMSMGARQWGAAMQDDVTDATRWLAGSGTADPARICIYGASYGGYAALMAAAREPALYRCAVGYVGVYDLPEMRRADARLAPWLSSWQDAWIGTGKDLEARSPVNLADRITVPVFLAAGGEDLRAPLVHTRRMEKALAKAGKPVESLVFDSEGHGFVTRPHRQAYYTRLLAFLSRHIGGATATGAPAAAGGD